MYRVMDKLSREIEFWGLSQLRMSVKTSTNEKTFVGGGEGKAEREKKE